MPQSWLGVTTTGPMLAPGTDLAGEMSIMVTSGAESVRVPFDWSLMQPHASATDVPDSDLARFRDVRGVPTDFTFTDGYVAAAAQRRLSVLPVVTEAPGWARLRPAEFASPPRRAAQYAAFVRALAERYGPRGTFWSERPELPARPIRDWQLWNEPSVRQRWRTRPFAPSYVALLRATRPVLRRADPGARVVLAGLPNFSWRSLAAIYRAGGRPFFDVVAPHPYTFRVAGVVRILENNREVMARFGDAAKPLMVTEVSWVASKGLTREQPNFPSVTEAVQAQRVREVMPALARARARLRIERVYWYSWLSPDYGSADLFDYAGLRRLRNGVAIDKPAARAFRTVARRLEGCVKGAVATHCR